MSITVVRPGLLTTIQDIGRYGFQKYGVIVSGAMDSYSLRLGNLLVGNEDNEAGLEITLMGPTLEIDKHTLFAITGADLSPTINGEPVPMWKPVYIRKKSVLQFGACKSGARAYLTAAGGFDIPEVMGSKSTYLRAGIGGYKGRQLQKEDVIQIKPPQKQSIRLIKQLENIDTTRIFSTTPWHIKREYVNHSSKPIRIRVMRDRQFNQFTSESKERLFSCPFKVTAQSDRMGYRLSGPNLSLEKPLEMISEGVTFGTIQVPADGNPIILLADRQTIGGYPKIAQVAAVDIPKVVQVKPGEEILFQEISLEEAENLYMEREKYIQSLKIAIKSKT
jgi:antagonist of KipI